MRSRRWIGRKGALAGDNGAVHREVEGQKFNQSSPLALLARKNCPPGCNKPLRPREYMNGALAGSSRAVRY
jgi:hypothetical protein